MKAIKTSRLVSKQLKELSPFDLLSGMVREMTGMAKDIQDEDAPFFRAGTKALEG